MPKAVTFFVQRALTTELSRAIHRRILSPSLCAQIRSNTSIRFKSRRLSIEIREELRSAINQAFRSDKFEIENYVKIESWRKVEVRGRIFVRRPERSDRLNDIVAKNKKSFKDDELLLQSHMYESAYAYKFVMCVNRYFVK